ncbi:MAG: YjgP/YjgQ family permease [Candidatus Latescibacteria bacterium]|nr:YjgP/YjgQ family permease [Candidatus Latescibacterota bacterium]
MGNGEWGRSISLDPRSSILTPDLMLIHRYILREHISPFLLALSVILFLLFVNLILELVDQIVGKGVPAAAAVEVFVLNLAWMVALAVPMAVLVAVLMAFGRLSSDGEVTALKAVGIGLPCVGWPVLVCAALLAGLTAWFNDRVLPDANHRARMLMDDIRRKRPSVALADKPGLVIDDFDAYRILIGGVDPHGSGVEDILIYRQQSGEFPTAILARRGEISFTPDRKDMILTLHDGEVHALDSRDQSRYVRTTFSRQVIVLGDAGKRLVRTVEDSRGDREMRVAEMRVQVARHAEEVRQAREDVGKAFETLARGRLLGDGPPPADPLKEVQQTLAQVRSGLMVVGHRARAVNRYRVEIQKKYAISAACIVFVFVGLPLGIAFRAGGATRGAAVSIGFFLLYWMFLIGGEKLADRGYLSPALSMWAANILIGSAGVCLTWREMKK